jgi:hypothetical protein
LNKLGLRNRLELLKIATQVYIADKKYARTKLETDGGVLSVSLSNIYDDICSIVNAEKQDAVQQVIDAADSGHGGLRQAIRDIVR